VNDRMIAHLEGQLVNAHAENADLRKRVVEVEEKLGTRSAIEAEAERRRSAMEKAHTKQKAAEENAAAAQRKCEGPEREALRARSDLEELRDRFEIVKTEADRLHALEDPIAQAKHVSDLFSS
jgi:uncharacterized protein (DUF3084 family)